VSLIGAILIGALTLGTAAPELARAAVVYPFVLGGISVLGALIGILFVNLTGSKPTATLMGAVVSSGIVSAVLFWPATHALFPKGFSINGIAHTSTDLYYASLIGLLMTAVVVVITNYYTSMNYAPVRKIAALPRLDTPRTSSPVSPLVSTPPRCRSVLSGSRFLLSNHFAGLYGIAIAVMSMLSMAGIIISLDAFARSPTTPVVSPS